MANAASSWTRRGLFLATGLSLLTSPMTARSQTSPNSPDARLTPETRQLLSVSSRVLREGTAKKVQMDRLRRVSAPSRLDVLVIGCDFSDSLMFGRDPNLFPGWPEQSRVGQLIFGTDIPMFAAHDSTYFDVQMHRVDEYFRSVSFGRFSLNWSVYPTIINLPRPMSYYGDPDSSDVRCVRMASEVVEAIDASVDFGLYDTVILVHAGAGSETDILSDSPEQIPSNYLDRRDFEEAAAAGLLPGPELLTAEGPIDHVLVLPEAESQDPVPEANFSGYFDTLGIYAFEIGLRLGMLSLSDFTPAGRPDSQGIGNYGLMGYGLFTGLSAIPSAPCAINRVLMGWTDPLEVGQDAQVRLSPMSPSATANDTLVARVPINDREYWLLEYRLQDPDGNLAYTFSDSNGNRLPDFYDADSDSGNGWPTGSYDPSEDAWESVLGSEWDYRMSENPARTPDKCMRGGGSGVYIYHVDERVIENSLLSGVNTINADPRHKGVDVEEADGIEDLDSSRPSAYILGWDGDCFRGEGATVFGPDTLPSTDSAAGVPTGIRFSDFSKVVQDTFPKDDFGDCTGFVYSPQMSFRVEFGNAGGGPALAARRHLRGIAPLFTARAVDLGSSAADPTPDGRLELVCVADSGRVMAYDADLAEWSDGDGNPATEGVLAVATTADGLARWTGAPVVEDFDEDGQKDILAASASALIALDAAGQELLDGDADAATRGPLWVPTAGEIVSPVIWWGGSPPTLAVVVAEAGELRLTVLRHTGGAVVGDTSMGVPGKALGPATLTAETPSRVVVPFADASSGGFLFFPVDGADPVRLRTPVRPASLAATNWESSPGSVDFFWTDREGSRHRSAVPPPAAGSSGQIAEGTWIDRARDRGERAHSLLVGADPVSGGGQPLFAEVVGGHLLALDAGMSPLPGFPFVPRRPSETASTDSVVVAPAMVDLDADGVVEMIWADGEGSLHAVDLSGQEVQGWPGPGPAEALDAPLIADVDGDQSLEMVVVSRFLSLRGADAPAQDFESEATGEIRVYDLGVAAGAHAPVGAGALGPHNSGVLPAGALTAGAGAIFDEGSMSLRPNPAIGSEVRVRVVVGRGVVVRAVLYNLEGEEVARSAESFTDAHTAFDESIDISGLVSGLYVCRVVSGSDSIHRPFAVVR